MNSLRSTVNPPASSEVIYNQQASNLKLLIRFHRYSPSVHELPLNVKLYNTLLIKRSITKYILILYHVLSLISVLSVHPSLNDNTICDKTGCCGGGTSELSLLLLLLMDLRHMNMQIVRLQKLTWSQGINPASNNIWYNKLEYLRWLNWIQLHHHVS